MPQTIMMLVQWLWWDFRYATTLYYLIIYVPWDQSHVIAIAWWPRASKDDWKFRILDDLANDQWHEARLPVTFSLLCLIPTIRKWITRKGTLSIEPNAIVGILLWTRHICVGHGKVSTKILLFSTTEPWSVWQEAQWLPAYCFRQRTGW